MSRHSAGVMLSSLGLVVAAVVLVPARTPPPADTATLSRAVDSAAIQANGRYKKQGSNCEWDAKDSGPNQCEPMVKGLFKKGVKDSCTWDAAGLGADQCRPPKGRWKKGGDNSCAWDANDSGPDQCNPRQAR